LKSQIRNIEEKYGKTMKEWSAIIGASGLTKHGQVVAMLKEQGLPHGAAHRIALTVLKTDGASVAKAIQAKGGDPVLALYAGPKESLRPIHDRIMGFVQDLGTDLEMVPKKGYVSLRRTKQFAMIQPSTRTRVDVGLVLKGVKPSGRLESAEGFNALFTHRVRLENAAGVDADLKAWLKQAYKAAV
jgi:hypothetical protein